MSREAVLEESVEWLELLLEGRRREHSLETLRLSRAVASMFSDKWAEVQRQLEQES